MTQATGTLMAHAPKITRAQLAALPKPQSLGKFHKPIPHIELIETLEDRVKAVLHASFSVEQFAVRRNGSTLFGVVTITYGEQRDLSAAIGFRHANDKSLSLQFVAGMSVFVCDNMVMRGDTIFLREKHLIELNLAAQIDAGLATFKTQYQALVFQTNDLKATEMSDTVAKSMIHDAFLKGVMPLKLMPKVSGHYFKPTHAEFEPRTGWSLYNAFTEVAKDMRMTPRMESTQALGTFFGLKQLGE
jgi:hypothetical protein